MLSFLWHRHQNNLHGKFCLYLRKLYLLWLFLVVWFPNVMHNREGIYGIVEQELSYKSKRSPTLPKSSFTTESLLLIYVLWGTLAFIITNIKGEICGIKQNCKNEDKEVSRTFLWSGKQNHCDCLSQYCCDGLFCLVKSVYKYITHAWLWY